MKKPNKNKTSRKETKVERIRVPNTDAKMIVQFLNTSQEPTKALKKLLREN